MTKYFDRVCRIEIQGKSKLIIVNNRISFETTKSIEPQENIGHIEIWNIGVETRRLITAHNSQVRLFAGYSNSNHRYTNHIGIGSRDNLVEIAQGDITNVKTRWNKTDTVTQIYFAEGQRVIRGNPISLSFSGNVTLSNILRAITAKSGLSFKYAGINPNSSILEGYSAFGSVDTVLNNLALEFDFKWSIQNGVVLLKGSNRSRDNEVMLLSPETGLILNPESVKKISRRLAKSGALLEDNINAVQSLLQPHLQVNDVIAIRSNGLNGQFRIVKISHTGDSRGNNWYSNMEVLAA